MKPVLFILLLAFLFGCKDGKKEAVVPTTDEAVEVAVKDSDTHPGKKYMETECYVCHNPSVSQAKMIAPPMVAIKMRYIDSSTTKEAFTKALIRWVNDPETASKMPGALKRFGCMPYMPHPDGALKQIADYLYEHEVEKPDWFDAHYAGQHGKGRQMGKGKEMGQQKGIAYQEPEKIYANVGLGYALATQAQLGKNLKKAIQEGGPVGAIAFCNEKALKLTDSMSVMSNAVIKRVSDKPRNPNNKANGEELAHIASFKKTIESGEEPSPFVQIENGEVQFYYPITTNVMCLQCHGKPNEQVGDETLTMLKKLYPNDQAVGYDVNQVRGMWSIVFDENGHD
ncbi:DUF3365 domain-containing protein [Flavobacteriaceae bacterium TP-CH-4]|uniref:DUF3365 domain-containing protein n=1 Tax=Pelagihabitans pacificus TaxID=2696054 RepID=A0A967AV88_9FLAO|nr:DUF3365 domain-containing protein [Pelagihabitans pacificus]NHF59668.1 DUF3365 domain-containing protein [Pelagihabitans pacificus]